MMYLRLGHGGNILKSLKIPGIKHKIVKNVLKEDKNLKTQ